MKFTIEGTGFRLSCKRRKCRTKAREYEGDAVLYFACNHVEATGVNTIWQGEDRLHSVMNLTEEALADVSAAIDRLRRIEGQI